MGRMAEWRAANAIRACEDYEIETFGELEPQARARAEALLREAQLEFGRALVEHLRAEGCLSWKSGWPVEVDLERLVEEL